MHKAVWIVVAAAILTLVQSPITSQADVEFDSGMYYLDIDIYIPAVVIPAGGHASASIVVEHQGYDDPSEFIGVRFAVRGLPTTWFAVFSYDPSLIVVGDPLTGVVEVQFPACQASTSSQDVVVAQMLLFASTDVQQESMYITGGNPNDLRDWPVMLSCDPTPLEHPTYGGQLILNPYTVGVEATNWSTVKELYRP